MSKHRPESVPWRDKAQRLIGLECRQSWLIANRTKSGKIRKKHVPYSVPELATELIRCLNEDDELAAKQLFLEQAR